MRTAGISAQAGAGMGVAQPPAAAQLQGSPKSAAAMVQDTSKDLPWGTNTSWPHSNVFKPAHTHQLGQESSLT